MNKTTKIRVMKKGTRKHYLLLQKLYPSMVRDKTVAKIKNNTYGEMEYSGIKKLFKIVSELHNIETFIDIGSGRGKICMAMAMYSQIKKIIGIELIKERHDDAVQIKSQLESSYTNKIEFINDNVLNVKLDKLKNVFVWFSNLCFDQDTTNSIFLKLKNELPEGSIVCCSNSPNVNIGEFINTVYIEMSWIENSSVKIYKIKK
jgi:hypothetical protein